MQGLPTLIKLQKARVDEQQQILAKLIAHLERVEKDMRDLEELFDREQAAFRAHPEMGQTYGAFVKRSIERARQLEKDHRTAETAVDLARNRLAELFEEQKRYEIALANRLAAAEKEENRRERILLDEVGSVSYARKHRESA